LSVTKKINVGIIGVSGYTGLELVKMLINHPTFNLNYVANSQGDTTLDELHPSLSGVCSLEVKKADDLLKMFMKSTIVHILMLRI